MEDMQNKPLILAGGAVVVGVMLAVAVSGSRIDGKLAAAMERAEAANVGALEDATEALTARIAELESSLSEKTAAASAAVDEKLAALEADVSDRITAVSQAAEASAQDLEAALNALATARGSASAGAGEDMSAKMQTAGPLGVGQTAIFVDGAVRAFVSSLDRDAGAARLSLNGETVTLGLGETETVSIGGQSCAVGLAVLDNAGATIGSDCGASGASDVAAAVPPAPEDGYPVGATALLAEGALRVFVSALAGDGASARLAINGIDTQVIASGSSIAVAAGDQSCDLTVTGVGDGIVGLEATCG
jgi:hypothetical protein